MIVTDAPLFSGCLIAFCLIVFALFYIGFLLSKCLGLAGADNELIGPYEMIGPLIVFGALWWYIRYRRRKRAERYQNHDYDYD